MTRSYTLISTRRDQYWLVPVQWSLQFRRLNHTGYLHESIPHSVPRGALGVLGPFSWAQLEVCGVLPNRIHGG